MKVEAENPLIGNVVYSNKAYLTLAAVNEKGNRVEIPQMLPKKGDDVAERRWTNAGQRR